MSNARDDITACLGKLVKIVLSEPTDKENYTKINIKPVEIKGERRCQAERFKDKKVFHLNMKENEFIDYFSKELDGKYRQILVVTQDESFHYHLRSGAYGKKTTANKTKQTADLSHNRSKEYILGEGENIPALVELGVFTPDFRIVKAKYDKYKQINRFIELVDDEFSKFGRDEITILDFGCGKSYLTFILYYYFTVKRGIKAKIIGYDLKRDVVENCNAIAQKYGYDGLKFVVSDVTKDALYGEKIDMIVTLHACDTATDYALEYAIKKNVKYIFSVPCCQHEINKQITPGGDMDIMLRHGIIKERLSALLTDSIRAAVLEDMGYAVDMIEFIDFAHSPKNIMIRAKKTKKRGNGKIEEALKLCEKYHFGQTLLDLVGSQRSGEKPNMS